MKIQLTSKNKVNNPVDNSSNQLSLECEFDGSIFEPNSDNFKYFKNQKNNFETLNLKLEKMNLNFEYIWFGYFLNDSGHQATNFIRTNENDEGIRIYWHKYSTKTPGSGQNLIYVVKDDKVKNSNL